MSLVSRINELATAIGVVLKSHAPRLLPPGGLTGHALVKTAGTDNAVTWAAVGTVKSVNGTTPDGNGDVTITLSGAEEAIVMALIQGPI